MTTTAATDAEDFGAHPRFAEALRVLGLDDVLARTRRFPEATRTDAGVVRETTGYAIGGVPPFGHRTRTRVLADRSLLAPDLVGAAAGTPCSVFPVEPEELVAHAGATLVDVREQSA